MGGLGLGVSPLFAHASKITPEIVPTAMATNTPIFGASSLYAYTRPKDSLLTWGSSLYGCLFGIIGLQITGLLANLGNFFFTKYNF